MASIGTFKKSGHEFQGEIVTLSVQTKGVRIVPETNRASENAPSHRVYVGRAEIGAAWSKRSSEGRDYLSVKLDDPSFTVPIYANLVEDLFEYLVAFILLVFELVVHDVVNRVTHHLLFHVHRRALALKVVHDALDLRKVESPVHALHRLSYLHFDHQH